MRRRIQRKPIKQIREKGLNEQSVTKGLNIQQGKTIFEGTTGLIVAVLWLVGRYYAPGYFRAMYIPSFQINLSVWEYEDNLGRVRISDKQIAQVDAEIDHHVYELYGLTEEEIRIVEHG